MHRRTKGADCKEAGGWGGARIRLTAGERNGAEWARDIVAAGDKMLLAVKLLCRDSSADAMRLDIGGDAKPAAVSMTATYGSGRHGYAGAPSPSPDCILGKLRSPAPCTPERVIQPPGQGAHSGCPPSTGPPSTGYLASPSLLTGLPAGS